MEEVCINPINTLVTNTLSISLQYLVFTLLTFLSPYQSFHYRLLSRVDHAAGGGGCVSGGSSRYGGRSTGASRLSIDAVDGQSSGADASASAGFSGMLVYGDGYDDDNDIYDLKDVTRVTTKTKSYPSQRLADEQGLAPRPELVPGHGTMPENNHKHLNHNNSVTSDHFNLAALASDPQSLALALDPQRQVFDKGLQEKLDRLDSHQAADNELGDTTLSYNVYSTPAIYLSQCIISHPRNHILSSCHHDPTNLVLTGSTHTI